MKRKVLARGFACLDELNQAAIAVCLVRRRCNKGSAPCRDHCVRVEIVSAVKAAREGK